MKIEKMKYKNLSFIISKPNDFSGDKQYPAILFLHGAGSRGNDIDILAANPYFQKSKSEEFITFAPQCFGNTWFDIFEQLKDFALFAYQQGFVDKERFYCMGASMGGYGTWELVMDLPEIFAAAIPICGGGMYWNCARMKNVPVWAFHGEIDTTVFCEESRKMVDAVNKSGGKARLTVYPDTGHDAWSETYENAEVFDWLLTNRRKASDDAGADKYNNSRDFG